MVTNSESIIQQILEYCGKFPHNTYFFQSKNPFKWIWFDNLFPAGSIFCTTIETNRPDLIEKYSGGQIIEDRIEGLKEFWFNKRHVTIEPIMDFDLDRMIYLMRSADPVQINIGGDSSNNNLHEPPSWKIKELIKELETFTVVHQKKNLRRLLK